MNSINTRLDGVEDMAAEAADFSAGAGTGNDYDEDDSQSQESTNARTEGVRQRRQERATAQQAAAHANVVTEITAKIGSIYTAGMRDDPAVRKAAALFQEAVKDPSRTTDLYKALEMLRDEAPRFAESKETTEQGDDPPKGESESSSQGSDDSSNSDTDDEDDEEEVDETPTKREALIASTSTQGQRNNGISPSGDDSNMGALDMFEAHLSGKTPPGQ